MGTVPSLSRENRFFSRSGTLGFDDVAEKEHRGPGEMVVTGTSSSSSSSPAHNVEAKSSSTSDKSDAAKVAKVEWTLQERRAYLASLGIFVNQEEVLLQVLADAMGGTPLPWPWVMTRNRRGRLFFANK